MSIPEYGLPQRQSAYASDSGFWRDGKVFIMHKNARMPDFCFKCGSPANGFAIRKNLAWHHPAIGLLVLAGLLIYLIVAAIVRKRATVEISICEEHRKTRRSAIIISWALFAMGVGFFILAAAQESGGSFGFGVILMFAAAIHALIRARLVVIKKIDDNYVWLKGAHESFLALAPVVNSSGRS